MFALYLALHCHGEWHKICEEQGKQLIGRKMFCEEGLPIVDQCQERPNDQGHLDREQQRLAFQARDQKGAQTRPSADSAGSDTYVSNLLSTEECARQPSLSLYASCSIMRIPHGPSSISALVGHFHQVHP